MLLKTEFDHIPFNESAAMSHLPLPWCWWQKTSCKVKKRDCVQVQLACTASMHTWQMYIQYHNFYTLLQLLRCVTYLCWRFVSLIVLLIKGTCMYNQDKVWYWSLPVWSSVTMRLGYTTNALSSIFTIAIGQTDEEHRRGATMHS